MPADRLLATVLRAYQNDPNPAETDKILGTTATLLTNLNNPLNLSLLTSHFLTARAIWQFPDGLRTCLRIISIYNTAAVHVRKNELQNADLPRGQPPVGSGVHSDSWARAVAKGADDRSSRWQHVLVLAGILMGMEAEDRRSLSRSLRSTLEQAVVTAANLSLQDPLRTGPLGRGAVVLALTYAFPLLSHPARQLVDGNALLPALIEAMLGEEGFQHGDFVSSIAGDIVPGQNISWHGNSPSVARLQKLESRPLAQNMGPLSRLASFTVQHATDSNIVLQAHDQLLDFTAGLLDKWTHCALSAVDAEAEAAVLSPEILQGPYPVLWQLLKKILYTVVATMQSVVGRSLLDPSIRNDIVAPSVAAKTLHSLRNLSFISTRRGASSFQVYTFTYLTSLDTITRYPDACVSFLQETQPPPPQTGNVVPSPVVQATTLFYLNTAEHLPLALPTPACEALVIAPAAAYLSPTSWLTCPSNTNTSSPPSSLTLELFESAHSAVLSALSCPQHAAVAASLVPFYVDALLASFPSRVSPRQFRLAFRAVVQIASPPYPLSASHPDLAETLLEMLRFRALEGGASTAPLLPPAGEQAAAAEGEAAQPISEQTALVLALLDALPYLPLHAVEEWLARAAEAMNAVADPAMREVARRRFWDVLVGGEMDVERSALGVAWWGTAGGREMVLLGRPRPGPGAEGDFLMSGALAQGEQGSKL
ncbi:peroxin 8 [Hypoxylon rubiginosum]|uniref:Peroxin 8 n=1 Tax=Hypoxylon rubiginosum TaxID=110542 RepID=A0ACB9ZGB1_9PEZI|nr:peroxin 8 [Hypoxylon rubiginosum]